MGFPYSYRKNNQANKPGINIKNHKEKTYRLINFTVPIDINLDIDINLKNYQNIKIIRFR